MRLPILAAAFASVVSPLRAHAQASPAPVVNVERLMTVEQFRAAGLTKLSPDELTALNTWLEQFSLRLAQLAAEPPSTAAPSGSATADAIETRIEGEFNGWDGSTVFKLSNGQIWQQASYAYTYHYAYRPQVLIYKTNGGYRMKVDGVSATIVVRRLK